MIRYAYRRRTWYTASLALVAASLALLPATLTAQTTGTSQLPGHLPPILATSKVVGHTNPNENVQFALVLPLRNEAQLDDLLNRLYDPLNTAYGHYLTPQEFTANFGPNRGGLPGGDRLCEGTRPYGNGHPSQPPHGECGWTVNTVESALGVQLLSYQDRSGRIFRAPAAEPVVPTALAQRLAGIVGLDTAAKWHPHSIFRKSPLGVESPRQGTGPQGGLFAQRYPGSV